MTITATYTRSKEMMQQYLDAPQKDPSHCPFTEAKEGDGIILKQFDYWLIMDNLFPYDAIAEVNHMIFPKRKVAFDWDLLSQEERNELEELKKTYISEHYDVLYENLPSGQTKPGYFHLHLLKLKRSSVEEFMKSQ